ncbi:hypothetical protein J437_LFUL003742 [Ladona fulva]|uniref:RNA (guanine-9-)-methyltransferase domain-containing protein 1 n=1 Tax=Ladona fulva TaxID=123851 RepID=A0A8K0JXG5_LADFU|nr:hypothetical protein J437_LFUL003742 [Ladona fulva]
MFVDRRLSTTIESNSVLNQKEYTSDWVDIENLDINSVTGGDPALEKKLRILFLEREILKQDGCKVPSYIKQDQWKELLMLSSRNQRKNYLKFLFGIEMKIVNRKRRKEENQTEIVYEKEAPSGDDSLAYGFGGSTIFMRVRNSTIDKHYNYNAIRAMIFGQKLVFDCSYDSFMTSRECKNCAKQLMLVFSENRVHPDPFNLYLTSARRDSPTIQALNKFIPTLYEDAFPLNVSEKSYLDLFSKENLVYLTPHCREELTTYSHDDVYIVGGIVDKSNNEPLSLAKAKKEGLRMAKLPLDRYLDWGSGSGKSLTLNHMLRILLDQKVCGDWKLSLRHIPQRKLIRERPTKSKVIPRNVSITGLFSS